MADKFSRTNSICPSPEELLYRAVERNNCDEIEKLCINNKELLRFQYKEYENRTILLIACSLLIEDINAETVECLLNHNADPHFSLQEDKNWTALHFSVLSNRFDIVRILIKHDTKVLNDLTSDGENALHILVNETSDDFSENLLVHGIQILIDCGINVNQLNRKNKTPLKIAIQKSYKELVKSIIDSSSDIEIELSDRQIIEQNNWCNLRKKELKEKTPKDSLFAILRNCDEKYFLQCEIAEHFVNSDDGIETLLQAACRLNLIQAVKYLLDNGADPYLARGLSPDTPIEISVDNRSYEIFEILFERHFNDKEPIPCKVLIKLCRDIEYKQFLELLLKKDFVDLNRPCSEKRNCSMLHYLVRYGDSEQIKMTLRKGASLAVRNDYNIMPVQSIEPDLLEEHLDDCIEFGKEGKDDPTIFNFQTLVVPKTEFHEKVENKDDNVKINITTERVFRQYLNPETDVVLFMSKSTQFRHLLKHPVIVTFLLLKWHRLRWLFRVNLAFYVTFLLSLIFYSLFSYANFKEDDNKVNLAIGNFAYIILCITFAILCFRELFQFLVSPSIYLKNLENYLEISLIIMTFLILSLNQPNNETKKQLSSLSILFAAFELVLMVGQHPRLSTNVEILRKVLYNFFILLLWYSILIIAFVLSFYLMFADSGKQDDEENSFRDPGQSFFKTIIMITGEFDASSIQFNTVLSKIIFCLFIFMISIILLNLLNGLAVSDIQVIKNDAELVGLIARTKYVSYAEQMIIGNRMWPKMYREKFFDLFCCLPNCKMDTPPRTIDKNQYCLLKNYLHEYKVNVYLLRHGLISVDGKSNSKCTKYCNLNLDKETVQRIKAIRYRHNKTNSQQCDNCKKLIEFYEELFKKSQGITKSD